MQSVTTAIKNPTIQPCCLLFLLGDVLVVWPTMLFSQQWFTRLLHSNTFTRTQIQRQDYHKKGRSRMASLSIESVKAGTGLLGLCSQCLPLSQPEHISQIRPVPEVASKVPFLSDSLQLSLAVK